MSSRTILSFLVIFLLTSSGLIAQEQGKTYTLEALEAMKARETGDKSIVTVSDEELRTRLANISNQIPMEFNSLVKSHITAYTQRRRRSTEKIIGRSSIYFSIFENALARHGIPTDLKYLAIVESALDPTAVSPVGATGLWQFMSATGRRYGLRISKTIDERRDPYMSSDAAARYLADLYDRYHDWGLAIAAYNCGPGNVNKAMKRSGNNTYWTIKNYLPRETRNYVPAFIAVAYSLNYYHLHNIYPIYPEYDLQVTEHLRVFKKMSLKDIATATNTSYETVKFLNPAFKAGYIPANEEGYIVSVPLAKMTAFKSFYPEAQPAMFYTPAPAMSSSVASTSQPVSYETQLTTTTNLSSSVVYEEIIKDYVVKRGDNLIKIASRNNCTVRDLRKWNGLKGSLLQVGQKLEIRETKAVQRTIEAPQETVLASSSPTTATTPQAYATTSGTQAIPTSIAQAKSLPTTASTRPMPAQATIKKQLYKVQRGDSIWKVASKFEVSAQDIIRWNNMMGTSKLYPGTQLIIQTTEIIQPK